MKKAMTGIIIFVTTFLLIKPNIRAQVNHPFSVNDMLTMDRISGLL